MKTEQAFIPYEKQSDPLAKRGCGAACLSMVYRSLGKEVPQEEIWAAIAKENRFGSLASTTHLMARDALNRGFAAVAIQARYPLQALRLCYEGGTRAILNLRALPYERAGHYSVLVDISDQEIVLHDPLLGPARRLEPTQLLELWEPLDSNSEIVGHVVIGVGTIEPPVPACRLCGTPIPTHVDCPNCSKPVSLQPLVLLGCMNSACVARMWNYICCPSCDYTWPSIIEAPEAEAAAPDISARRDGIDTALPPDRDGGLGSHDSPLNLQLVFGEIDKFCNHILSLPAAANHPDIRAQMDFIKRSKEQLRLALAQDFAQRRAYLEQLAAFAQAAKQKQEAHLKKKGELDTPPTPLDGNALGTELLKHLGFIR